MSQAFRTASGGRIRRDRPIGFMFDGQSYTGFEGDTLASALLANDVHLVGRSFKYHRPRGIVAAGGEEPNALVTVDRGGGRITPNLRATQVELYDGLHAHSQNRWPSLALDVGALAGAVAPLLGAGFYYKTFMWPRSFWARLYEPAIRAAAGLGRAPKLPDPDRYLHRYAHCDVLVIGSGPAGLAAALTASAAGARVMLCDEQAEFGGALLGEPDATIDGVPASHWVADALDTLTANGVILLQRTTAFGWSQDNLLGLVQSVTDHLSDPDPRLPRERLWQVRAHEVVIATGAIERPLVFPHNDRPGVMLVDAARTYLVRYGVKVGARAVVATAHDSAYHAALALQDAGVAIAAIADARQSVDAAVQEAVRAAGIPLHLGSTIRRTAGRMRVGEVRLSSQRAGIPCDTVLMCGGWTPSVHLFSQSRGRLRFDAMIGAFVPAQSAANERSAGACAGMFGLGDCLAAGCAAGESAAKAAGFEAARVSPVSPAIAPSVVASSVPAVSAPASDGIDDRNRPGHDWEGGGSARGSAGVSTRSAAAPHAKAFVDLQNDVTTKDLAIATREGFRSIEHVKRYTTTGMATDQGKTSNVNALATVSGLLSQPVVAIGHTTFRMPYTPVTFGAFAGAARGTLFDPLRYSPLHAWAEQHGGLFEDVGTWRRARCFPQQGEDRHAAVARECRAVRSGVGLLDASTLGKIEVVGPDAAEFLNRLYTGNMAALAPGRCRYGVLLRETGFVFDDGVVARLAHDRFHVTTTTGGAAAVLHHMEDYLQTEFSALRVWLTSTTEHWTAIAVQGPRAGDVVAPLVDLALSDMPPMSVREGSICGIPCRLFSVSFTGEAGFEVNVPADHATEVWDALLEAGHQFGITPYGTDAMHVLRAEMGFIIIGQETDGTATPDDLGLAWAISRTKRDFVGRRSLSLPDMLRPDRKQLVGLLTADAESLLEEGAQVVSEPQAPRPVHSLGHVTSAYWSPSLQRSIALALVEGGRGRLGETLYVPMSDRATPDRAMAVTVTRPMFHATAEPEAAASGRVESEVAPEIPGPAAPALAAMPALLLEATGRVQPVAPHAGIAPYRDPDATMSDDAGSSAFGATDHVPAAGPVPVITILAPFTRLVVRADTPTAAAIGAAMGVLLGTAPCRSTTGEDRAALWLGPDEWLVFAPPEEADLATRVRAVLGEMPASVVDVSARSVSLQIEGAQADSCLNAFCALDLDLPMFPVGKCTRTVFGKAEIVLWRTGSMIFHIEVARSFAPYVRQCLEEAALEFLL